MTRKIYFNIILMSQKPILTYGVACLEILSCILIFYETYDLFKSNSKNMKLIRYRNFRFYSVFMFSFMLATALTDLISFPIDAPTKDACSNA